MDFQNNLQKREAAKKRLHRLILFPLALKYS